MSAGEITIFHNPQCGTSRNTLALLRERGLEPTVVEYLKVGWTKPQLKTLMAEMGVAPRDILRPKEAADRGVDASLSDDALLDAMVKDPILVNRPIVKTAKGVALCRPVERVLDLI